MQRFFIESVFSQKDSALGLTLYFDTETTLTHNNTCFFCPFLPYLANYGQYYTDVYMGAGNGKTLNSKGFLINYFVLESVIFCRTNRVLL